MNLEQELVVALLAGVSAFVAGLLGAGGDILFVPLLLYGLPALAGDPLGIQAVTALSLVGSLASTGGGGLRYLADGLVERRALWPAAGALAAGALFGGLLSGAVPDSSLLVVFALVTTGAALLFLVPPVEVDAPFHEGREPVAMGLLVAAGLVCGAVGVGGGFLIVAVLLYRMRLPMHAAKGTGLLLTVATAAPALLGKALTGPVPWSAVPWLVVAAVVGAVVGARAGAPIPGWALRWALAGLVTVLSARVWLDVLGRA